jgi:hypothetical protein
MEIKLDVRLIVSLILGIIALDLLLFVLQLVEIVYRQAINNVITETRMDAKMVVFPMLVILALGLHLLFVLETVEIIRG